MAKYNTRAMNEIEEFLLARKGDHLTISEIYLHFVETGKPIGKTTIYRKMDELIDAGLVKKHIIDKNNSAYFEYVGNNHNEDDTSYHLMCEKCGKIIHFHCTEATALWKHLSDEHNFQIDTQRVVLYGICDECRG